MEVHVKHVLLLAVVCVALLGVRASPAVSEAQMKQAARMVRNVCQPKTKVTDEQLEKLAAGDIENDSKVKCYVQCFFGMTQTMKAGKMDEKMIRLQANKMLPPDRRDLAIHALDACKDEPPAADPCDTAYNFLVCNQKDNPEKFFFPV